MLKINNFGIHYENTTILKNLNFEVNQGELVVITGKSGCGKSSFLKAINGIILDNEVVNLTGDIIFKNRSVLEKSISERSKFISTVFQNPKTQFFCTNTTDELAFALENRNIERSKILDTIKKYSSMMNTEYLLDKNIFSISGGEKQLVAITATSCMNNDIYLFDEPSASLDKKSIELLKTMLKKLKSMGKIIIIAEHRLYYLREIADKFIIFKNKTSTLFKFNDSKKSENELRTLQDISKSELKDFKFRKVNLLEENCVTDSDSLICKNFLVKYKKEKILNFSISFPEGINFIIGENGVGKSTFIKKLSGLIKGKSESLYKGKKIKKTYNFISMVMQDVNYQLFTESVWQELSIVNSDPCLKEKTLQELDLLDKKDFHPQILSGGEKQRLLIGMAKLSDKPVVILDEPTSGLCKGKMLKIIEYLHEMKENGKTVIVVTHDYEFIKKCKGNIYEFTK